MRDTHAHVGASSDRTQAFLHHPWAADTLIDNVQRSWPSRAAVVRTGVVFVALAAAATPVYAQTSAVTGTPGEQAMKRARSAWDDGDFDIAPGLYRSALAAGGLRRDDVVDAYVRMGSAFAVTGRVRDGIAAFRDAALLDPGFRVPPEAGRKAMALAERARREQRRVGSLALSAQVADDVKSGAPFGVDVALAPIHPRLVEVIHLEVRDSLAGHAYEQGMPPDTRVHFDVPTRMTLPDAGLLVRVRVADAQDNELLSLEKRVHVKSAVAAPLHPALVALRGNDDARDLGSGGGFWHTAWPYVIGGAALAAGGAAIYLGTRPTADVNVAAARVELTH
jgi:hypothetical protein